MADSNKDVEKKTRSMDFIWDADLNRLVRKVLPQKVNPVHNRRKGFQKMTTKSKYPVEVVLKFYD